MMRFPFMRRKGANASFERNWIHYWGGSPTLSNKMTHKGFLAAFQVSMLFMKFCIDGNGTPQGFWQPTEDDNMSC